jgi:membrane protease subunit (stomatin/prohibitin family)
MRRRAVVGGAVVGAAVAGSRHQAADEQAQLEGQQSEPAAEQPAAEAEPSTDEKLASVAKLAELHNAGVLTDEEFAQQKAQVLGP